MKNWKTENIQNIESESKGLKKLAAMGITRPTLPRGAALGQKSTNNSNTKEDEEKQDKNQPKNKLSKETEAEIYRARVRMRDVATGNTEIDPERRFYCCIQFSPKINKKEVCMFFDKNKTVGRILDEICDEKMIKNKNHLPGSDVKFIQLICTFHPFFIECVFEINFLKEKHRLTEEINFCFLIAFNNFFCIFLPKKSNLFQLTNIQKLFCELRNLSEKKSTSTKKN
ncbi:hypothetical protein RFI_00418 [Reticulomyxa filosa]|uniref:Uncharacterized protein n=1 Tax=Reticulomyxa filosa TaxID=46433 RepID=X6PG19_RETFI|nr:hypothetical protein RFI_00418 [Reticulomyxa filosa]|eukprot:ETO36642.1 hypothetical protein RFI_00418 [Reticulomyxa filosa]